MLYFYRYKLLSIFLLNFMLIACGKNIHSDLEQHFVHEDIQRTERIAKDALNAALQTEATSAHLIDLQYKINTDHVVYSPLEYNEKISHLKHTIAYKNSYLKTLSDTHLKHVTCQNTAPLFKQLDAIIYYHPEYAIVQTELDHNLNFLVTQHRIWANHCQNIAILS